MTRRVSLIAFEGCDGAGKSTAIFNYMSHVRRMQNTFIVHHHGTYIGLSGIELIERYSMTISSEVVSDRKPIDSETTLRILDRTWYSENVYHPIMRSHTNRRITESGQLVLDKKFMANHGILVLCIPPFEKILESHRRRSYDEYVKWEGDLQRVYDSYRGMKIFVPYIVFDFTVMGINTLHEMLNVAHKEAYS